MIKNWPIFYKTTILFTVLMIVSLSLGCESMTGKTPDFGSVERGSERKELFFAFMSPLIKAENDIILNQRSRLENLKQQATEDRQPGWLDRRWLEQLAADYGVDLSEPYGQEQWQSLLLRVDIVPRELALVQAAMESAWGDSRFAREGNNFYGEHCTTQDCGIVPDGRSPGEVYEVATFQSPAESVRSYIHNLNTHAAYENFRHLRLDSRKKGGVPDGFSLAKTLRAYSERNNDYILAVQGMITDNKGLMGTL